MILHRTLTRFAAVTAILLAAAPGVASAQTIYSPVGGVINTGGPGFGLLSETFDQSGLLTNFVSGATDFESYIASNPMHTYLFSGNEWWSNAGISSASVTYDMGSVLSVSKLALWNEESAGIGSLDLFGSLNGLDFFALSLGLAPPDNQGDPPLDYGATVFSWAATDLRYVRFDMSDCPQPQTTPTYEDYGCSIGEVAFSASSMSTGVVPEPGTVLLLGTGLLGLGLVARRRRTEIEDD